VSVPLLLEVLVIGRVMCRDHQRKSRIIPALPAGWKRLALHHGHLVLVLMGSVMYDVVDSGFRALIAWFELIHDYS
jgi:hypothetical protein